ncbi:nucleotide exchange factor GrpE [Candidatus Peregrinibacteria bacterium]|nr:nucleotide exchange factor GrpE [Candidatus Peregrinibacteria bacterium]
MTQTKRPPADDSSAQTPADELAQLREELLRLKEIAARAQADLQNAKIRMDREAQELRLFAVEGLMVRLLPTIDNFQRSFSHLPNDLQNHEWVKGIAATEQKLMKDLEAVGLKRIDPLGQLVDPVKHEVLQTAPGAKDTVVEVYEAGYELGGRVLKAAKVVAGAGE